MTTLTTSNPIALIAHPKGYQLFFDKPDLSEQGGHILSDHQIQEMAQNGVSVVDLRNCGGDTIYRFQTEVGFTPTVTSMHGLTGEKGMGHIDDWIALSQYIGAPTHQNSNDKKELIPGCYNSTIRKTIKPVVARVQGTSFEKGINRIFQDIQKSYTLKFNKITGEDSPQSGTIIEMMDNIIDHANRFALGTRRHDGLNQALISAADQIHQIKSIELDRSHAGNNKTGTDYRHSVVTINCALESIEQARKALDHSISATSGPTPS